MNLKIRVSLKDLFQENGNKITVAVRTSSADESLHRLTLQKFTVSFYKTKISLCLFLKPKLFINIYPTMQYDVGKCLLVFYLRRNLKACLRKCRRTYLVTAKGLNSGCVVYRGVLSFDIECVLASTAFQESANYEI